MRDYALFALRVAIAGLLLTGFPLVLSIQDVTAQTLTPENGENSGRIRSVEECMAIMTERRVRHLPVMEGEKIVGIVSIGDLVKSIIGDQKFRIDQLEHYIHG